MDFLDRCLSALRERCPHAEVVVADRTGPETRTRISECWPRVRIISFDEPRSIPELRAAGIAAARAPRVAVIEDHCLVHNGWADAVLAAHAEGRTVVGGPIRNAAAERVRDWAAFFCEYSEHMEPLQRGAAGSLPGMNVSYDRTALAAMAELLAEGRWESWLHPHLQKQGFTLWVEPEMLIEHAKGFGIREFVSQRYHYARAHAGALNDVLGRKRLLYLGGSPLLVPLLYFRIARNVLRKRRHRLRFLAATPLLLVYLVAWAAGEAVGHALGCGRSPLEVR
jgi:hypothetical protein